jgi:hypothetical protein
MKYHEDVWEVEVLAPHILNLSSRWRYLVISVPWPLYTQRKSPQYLLDRKLDGLQSQYGCNRKEKNNR